MAARKDPLRGLKRRRGRDNQQRLYWECTNEAREKGYQPALIKIETDDPKEIESLLREYNLEMYQWMAELSQAANPVFHEHTVASLIHSYRFTSASRFNKVDWRTQRTWHYQLNKIERMIGDVRIADITLPLADRFYEDVRYPEGKGPRKRDIKTTAEKIMGRLRALMIWGKVMDIAECYPAYEKLRAVSVEVPAPSESRMTYECAKAIVETAIQQDKLSIALGQAIQFESGLRQIDVIGEWEPIRPDVEVTSRFVMNNRQWVNGLMWEKMDHLVVTKKMTKTKAPISHDLKYFPLVMRVLKLIAPEKRVFGPVIIDERTKRPYAEHAYRQQWKLIARAAGVPEDVKNMTSRAGAISEMRASGVSLDVAQKVAGHTDPHVTQIYDRDYGLSHSRQSALSREKYREAAQGGGKTGGENV